MAKARQPVCKAPARPPRAATPVLPDRAAMRAFIDSLGQARASAATERAQGFIYDAWEASTARMRISLAHKALAASPLCADAYSLLAEEVARTPEEVREYYALGVEAGERALGPKAFKELAGEFWGWLETRPYMRARAGLAQALMEQGEEDAAIAHLQALLALNPNDNQGLRYDLLACLLRRNDGPALAKLLADYEDEGSPFWLYTRALLAFRERGANDPKAKALARKGVAGNAHVAAILAGTETPVEMGELGYTVGGPDEASYYLTECGDAWRQTTGAVAWLTQLAAARPRRRNGVSTA